MSKHDDDLPPSYDDLPSPSNPSSTVSATLTSLTSLLRTTQAQQSALDSLTTTSLLPLLTPHLTALLTRLGTTPHPPALAELVLVPAAAVAPSWQISSDADRQAGEVVQLVRVAREPSPDSKGGKEALRDAPPGYAEPSTASKGFDDWGRWDDDDTPAGGSSKEDEWWWDDEALAHRLARRLQPEPKVDRTVVRARVEQAKEEKKASRWGLFRGSSDASSSAPAPPSPVPQPSAARKQDDVTMTVRAEEVTFRRENEMGIWEGMRGWGIVARVWIRR